MNTTTLANSKFLTGKALGAAAAAAVIVLAIIGWTGGWFGAEAPATSTAPAVTTEQPAASASGQAPAQPSAGTSTTQ